MFLFLWMLAGFFICTWLMQVISSFAKITTYHHYNIIFGLIGSLVAYTYFNGLF
jgi:hypothetical protein